jgi:hypothetical protein
VVAWRALLLGVLLIFRLCEALAPPEFSLSDMFPLVPCLVLNILFIIPDVDFCFSLGTSWLD